MIEISAALGRCVMSESVMDSPAHPRTTLPARVRNAPPRRSALDELYALRHTVATGDDALVCTALYSLEKGGAPDMSVEPLAGPKPCVPTSIRHV